MPRTHNRKRTATFLTSIALLAIVLVASAFWFLGQRTAGDAEAAESYNATVPVPTVAPAVPPEEIAEAVPVSDIGATLTGPGDVSLVIFGDSTGNSPGEWVDLWAKELAQHGTVTLHMWDFRTEDYAPEPIVHPGEGKQITIWNGSMPGSAAGYAVDKMGRIMPTIPDIVMFNYGHNGTPAATFVGLQDTRAAVLDVSPEAHVVAILQNPAVGANAMATAANQDMVTRWAEPRNIGIIDVRSAFPTEPTEMKPLLLDDDLGVHPNEAGSKVWVDAVRAAVMAG